MTKILQTNLNHARQVQDLFHNLAERNYGLGIVAEPYEVPRNYPLWLASSCGNCMEEHSELPTCTIIEAGEGYVAAQWGRIAVFNVYLSLALDAAQYAGRLDWMGECARRLLLLLCPVLIMGDFNAKAQL